MCILPLYIDQDTDGGKQRENALRQESNKVQATIRSITKYLQD